MKGLTATKNDGSSVTFGSTNLSYTTKTYLTSVTFNDVITLIPGVGSNTNNSPSYNQEGTLRFYFNNTLTVKSIPTYQITKIKFTAAESKSPIVTSDAGEYDATSKTWTGEANEVKFTVTRATTNTQSPQFQVSSMEITYESTQSVGDVVVSYEAVEGKCVATLTCPTEDVDIYYGFSEDAVTTLYTDPFEVTEKCVVYAFAQAKDSEDKGNVSHTPINLYKSLKDLLQAENNEEIFAIGNFSVVDQTGNYVLLTDGANYMLVNGAGATDFVKGDNIAAIKATAGLYYKLFDLIEFTLIKGGDGAEGTFKEITSLSDVNYEDNLFEGVLIKGANISGKSGNNATITLGDETAALYNRFAVDFENGENFDIKCVVSRYNDNLQFVPVAIEGGVKLETVKNPVITPTKRELKENDEITITCATEGARIFYTLDETEPTEESTLYEGPFVFDVQGIGVGTVKARAFAPEGENMVASQIVEKEYRIFDPTCNILNTDDHVYTTTSYAEHTCTIDDVNYAMTAIHSDKGIQLNSKNGERYIIQTSENVGYVVDRIVIDYNTDASKNTASFAVRGSNSAVTATNYTTVGESVGTIKDAEGATSITFDKDFKYFSLYTATTSEGAFYLNSITIYYRALEDTDAPELEDEYEFISDENSLMLPDLPEKENWSAKYSVNDQEELDYAASGQLHEEALAAATTHTIKIWYEHDVTGEKSTPKEYKHLTAPQFTVETVQAGDEEVITIDFGTIGEGVTVLFRLDGQAPGAGTEQPVVESKAMAYAAVADGVYKVDSAADLTSDHSVTSETTKVEVHTPGTVKLAAKAIDSANNLESDVTTADNDVTTGVGLVVAGEAAEWYTVDGLKVSGELQSGLYIVVINGKAQKVMIRK